MVQYVITPWRNLSELLQVREKLYPGHGNLIHAEDRQHAVAQVSVWMQRGNCPHLVESTAILNSAILNDVPGNSSYCVRAAYSAAFCRFVTGLLDSHQDKRRKLSMYSIAKNIGLPATYVELRHQATHEELPSLSKLRTGTQKALRWIWDYYWVKLPEEIPEDLDCKIFVKEFVQQQDAGIRQKMEVSLGRWDEDRLLDALIDIQATADDSVILLRCLHLQRKLLSGNDVHVVKDLPAADKKTPKSLDEIRAQLRGIENKLDNQEDAGTQKIEPDVQLAVDTSGPGWTLWEEPWVPKPIGVV